MKFYNYLFLILNTNSETNIPPNEPSFNLSGEQLKNYHNNRVVVPKWIPMLLAGGTFIIYTLTEYLFNRKVRKNRREVAVFKRQQMES